MEEKRTKKENKRRERNRTTQNRKEQNNTIPTSGMCFWGLGPLLK
jgi:hypothetical protein